MKHLFSIFTAVFAVLAFLVNCGGSESKEPGSIYGVVTDKATGEPIKNAGVELKPVGLQTVTGSDGQFEFNEVAVGTYTLFATKTGYIDKSSDITVKSGQQSKGDVQLEKLPAALRIVNDDGKDISELDFGSEIADVSRQFNIFNDGTEKIKWKISYSSEWIESVSEESGELKEGGTQGVIVNINRSLLESGENVTTIHVTSNDGNKQLTVKATNATVLPTLNTLETTNITSSTAVLNAEILTKGVPSYSERGFVYALESNPTLENTIAQLTAKVTEEDLYSATVTGLELGSEYYARGYAINEAGVAYSTNVVSFKPHQVPPELTTEHPTNISISSGTATFNGTIVDVGDPAYTERGFVYGHDHNPTVEDDNKKEVTGNGEGAFSIKVTELEINTIYYIRAYAVNEAGIGYGNEIKLEFDAVQPIVYTKEATNVSIGAGTATFNGSIESVGDPAYTERGFVYGTIHNPTIEDDTKKVAVGSGTGAFSASVTELEMNTIYYIRAFATNSQGTTYGSEMILNFNAVMPVVNTSAVTDINIASGTATFNGSIESVGDPAYTERGFVYGLAHNPNIIDDAKKVASGSGQGDFSTNVTGLSMNNIYYIRAYAQSAADTVYGPEVYVGWPECSAEDITPCIVNNLMWSAKSLTVKYSAADSYCQNLNEGNFHDWRIPNIDELRSLLNCSKTGLNGTCKVSARTGCLSGDTCWSETSCGACGSITNSATTISKLNDNKWMWSSSSRPEGGYWIIGFFNGEIYRSNGPLAYDPDVRCVR